MKRSKRWLVFIFVFAFVFSIIMSSFVFADSKSIDKSKGNQSKGVKATVEEKTVNNAAFAKLAKEEKQRIKAEIRNNYSDQEMKVLQEVTEEIEEGNSDVDVLPVDTIIARSKKIKWDTPPVVKSGRILVPVRALTQAYGATVEWNQEEQKVTIVKDGKEIVIELNSKTVLVDGVAVELDVPAQSINSRTVVPLRFIVEQLGLKINWDDETDTAEIEDDEEATEEDVTGTEDTTDTTDTTDSKDDGSTTEVNDTVDSTADDNTDSVIEDLEDDVTAIQTTI